MGKGDLTRQAILERATSVASSVGLEGLTIGNLADNPRAMLFLMDYTTRSRIKIWGTARVEDDPELIAKVFPGNYMARAEQTIIFTVSAWDANCSQHIPQMLFAEDVVAAITQRDQRISELEAENARLRAVVAIP